MSIVSYERFDNDGIELVINTVTGESFATQAGYIRMSGAPKSTVSSRMLGVRKDDFQEAEVLTPGGLQGVRLVDEDTIADWLEKDNPSLLKKFSKLGIRISLHKIAGFEITSTAVNPVVAPPVPQLPQRDTIDYIKAANVIPNLKVNAHLKQLLEDSLTDELELMRNQKALPGGKSEYTIVKSRARELGYKVSDIDSGCNLGRHVAKLVDFAFRERIGKWDVKHYLVTPELDAAIHSYFA